MSYFLRNYNTSCGESQSGESLSFTPIPTSTPSTTTAIADGRRTFVEDALQSGNISSELSLLLKHCAKLPKKSYILRIPNVERHASDDLEGYWSKKGPVKNATEEENVEPKNIPPTSIDLKPYLQVVASPTAFGVTALARTVVLRYASVLEKINASSDLSNQENKFKPIIQELGILKEQATPSGNYLITLGLKCIFSVLTELNKRDPELCSQALSSLLQLIQNMPVDGLSAEIYKSIKNMYDMLKELRLQGTAEVSSMATSCMIGIAVAFGIPEFLLGTAASLFCDETECERNCSDPVMITIPSNHYKLANFVQKIVMNGSIENWNSGDWWSHPLTEHVVLSSFNVTVPKDTSPQIVDDRRLIGAIASDGPYVYILCCYGLFKYGTGLAETIAGKLYSSNRSLKSSKGSWLAMCNGSLYLRRRQSSRIWVIDTDTLHEIGEIMLHTLAVTGALMSDGYSFYQANIDDQWQLNITALDDNFAPITDVKQNPKYRLTTHDFSAFGDSQPIPHELPRSLPKSLQAHASDLQIGKETAFLLARTGKVYYAGNAKRYGLQNTNGVWMELVLPDSIVSVSVTNDSDTVLLRSGSGQVWILGQEPQTLNQGSPVTGRHYRKDVVNGKGKLRKLHLASRRKCISMAVSSGCIAYVTDNGRAYVFGRHAMNCNPETGQIYGLDNIHVAAISLGKTHAAAVTRHGHVYTWGLNNLNQCGRIEVSGSPRAELLESKFNNSKTGADENVETGSYCAPEEHLYIRDSASICVKCGECSVRGSKCSGESGASEKSLRKGTLCTCGSEGESCCLRCGLCRKCGERSASEDFSLSSSDRCKTPQRTILQPAKLILNDDTPNIKVSLIACGNYHTLVLGADRNVFAFGSNCHGQLGVGNTQRYVGPQKVEIPSDVQIVQIAAGANHSVLRTADGSVITFGAHRQGQLAREGKGRYWYAKPKMVPGFGKSCGTIATWVGAVGDVTMVHSQKRVFSSDIALNCQVVSNKSAVIIFPNEVGKDYVAIRKHYSGFYQHSLGTAGLYTSWCLEPTYNLMWSFNAAEMRVQSLSDSVSHPTEISYSKKMKDISILRAPEFIVPKDTEAQLSTHQTALSVLSATYVITALEATITEETQANNDKENTVAVDHSDSISANGMFVVDRFDGYGGGWGYSVHSVEAIQFRVSKEIKLLGVGLFGGRGEYIARLKLFRLNGDDSSDQNLQLIAESDEMLYQCAPREKTQLMFSKYAVVEADVWYVVCAQIRGPSSDCGAGGRSVATGDDGVQFHFRTSRLSNNGTDVSVGQIPELLYLSKAGEKSTTSSAFQESNEKKESVVNFVPNAIRLQSLSFVTPSAMQALLETLRWSIDRALEFGKNDSDHQRSYSTERAVIIGIISLRIFCNYVDRLFSRPKSDASFPTSSEYTTLVLHFGNILSSLFRQANEKDLSQDFIRWALMEEAVKSYVSCSSILLPDSSVIIDRLAYLMSTANRDWSLVALFDSLCRRNEVLPFLLFLDREKTPGFKQPVSLRQNNEDGTKDSIGRQHITDFQNVLRFLFELAFTRHAFDSRHSGARLKYAAQSLISSVARELVTPTILAEDGQSVFQTPHRFRNQSAQPDWDMSNGVADAISFRIDAVGFLLHGIGVYRTAKNRKHRYRCELLCNEGNSKKEQWSSITKTNGVFGGDEECNSQNNTAMIRFRNPVRLKQNVFYAVKFSLDGGKTFCGEGGLETLCLPNGSKLYFQTCSLSHNGTTVTRGQIPFLLHSYERQENRMHNTTDYQQLNKWFLLLVRLLSAKASNFAATGNLGSLDVKFFSTISGYIMLFLELNPQFALDVFAILDDLLPMISSSNSEKTLKQRALISKSEAENSRILVESPHPYVASTVYSKVVSFNATVRFVSIQFDEACRTFQSEDVLWIYVRVNHNCFVPVNKSYGSHEWPKQVIYIPGNHLWFILETVNGSEEADPKEIFGFRCTVTGYSSLEINRDLLIEQELAWISASACRFLVQIPSEQTVLTALTAMEEEVNQVVKKYGPLLRRGLNLSHMPSVTEILGRSLPAPAFGPDMKFIKQFIACSSNTAAGFLAKWLMVEPTVDIHSSRLRMPCDELKIGLPTKIVLIPRDQYGSNAFCPFMKVEFTVRSDDPAGILSEKNSYRSGLKSASPSDSASQQSIVDEPYRPVYMNRARYMAITMMDAYANYSFEELRLTYLKDSVLKEKLKGVHQDDGSFTAEWIPKQSSKYRIECKIDGFQLTQSYVVEVAGQHQRSTNFNANSQMRTSGKQRVAYLSKARYALCPRVLMTKGIRIRAAPVLSAPQIGIIPRGSVISYLEEVENVDGVWVKLTDETAAIHCESHDSQAWCLQYCNHLRKQFLYLVHEFANEMPDAMIVAPNVNSASPSENSAVKRSMVEIGQQSVLMDTNEVYVIDSDQTIPLYDSPSLNEACSEVLDGSVVKEISANGWLCNSYGVWIRIPISNYKYALVQDACGRCYFRKKTSSNVSINNGNVKATSSQRCFSEQSPNRSKTTNRHTALRPSIADCCRTVFAAFLWHEKLVRDAVACSAYLKFHPELYTTSRSDDRLEIIASTPLYPLTRFWHETYKVVQAGIQRNCLAQTSPLRSSEVPKLRGKSLPPQSICELCEEYQSVPVTIHMRMAHPGCDNDCGGYGYNSSGKYINGWSGKCGEGGKQSAAWYLLCIPCRSKYITQTPSGQREEQNRRKKEYHLSTAENGLVPEQIIKQNAMFLLELNPSTEDCDDNLFDLSSGWTINLYPQTNSTSSTLHSAYAQAGNGYLNLQIASGLERISHIQRRFSHVSDPGPKKSSTNTSFVGNESMGNIQNETHFVKDDYHSTFLSGTSAIMLRRSKDEARRRPSVEVFHSPSVALKRLFYETQQTNAKIAKFPSFSRLPVLAFVVEHHDLKKIKEAMATAVARATFFSHSLRVWNWLLKSVSSEASVSDILIQYLTALNSYMPLSKYRLHDVCRAGTRILPHPWSVCFLAGPVAKKVVEELHYFLHTVFLLTQSNNTNRVLRRLCFRVWTFQLTIHEKNLLPLVCNMLATVTTVLSDPSADLSCSFENFGLSKQLSPREQPSGEKPEVKELEDITMLIKIEASSRQAMVVCLTDGKPDTFWESAEEGKGGSSLKLQWNRRLVVAAFLAIYVDNVKDEGFALASVMITTLNQDNIANQIYEEHIDNLYMGWIKCCIANIDNAQITFEGSGPSVRIRQIRVLGCQSVTDYSSHSPHFKRSPIRPSPSHQLLFSPDQADAFALFQAISAQAFSDEFAQEENGALRQQVLELLLSRDQLPPLQSFVCSQMAVALEREVINLQEKKKTNYSYACGLMLMLIRICSSREGIELFGAHSNLLMTLSDLLVFAPSVVQYQVLETIERLISLFSPTRVDLPKFTKNLLIVIAKVISLQIKDKKAHSLISATVMTQNIESESNWRLDRTSSMEMAKMIVKLLKDVSEGSVNEHWKLAIQAELAEKVVELSQLDFNRLFGSEKSKLSSRGMKLPLAKSSFNLPIFFKSDKFWLSTAALAIITSADWLELSPTWQQQEIDRDRKAELLCENHDDGETLAEVFCSVCQISLCRECFTVLHLNKRNRSHELRFLYNPAATPRLDVHEGCTRFRLPNLLILFHPSTLNGMIELDNCCLNDECQTLSALKAFGKSSWAPFITSTSKSYGFCRFCGNQLKTEAQEEQGVCDHEDCLISKSLACNKKLFCGHYCGGIANEKICLPCITCKDPKARQDADDLCVICFTDRLGGAPCIRLECGHIFHFQCVKSVLEKRWSGPRIYFRFMQCPLCKQQIEHPALSQLLSPLKTLHGEVVKKALLRLEYDGLLDSPAITSKESIFYQNPEMFAMERYVYVLCFKCGKAYFGGESRCQQALDTSQYNETELLCGACSDVNGAQVCGRHGVEYLEYKCRFCCSVAVYFCFGTTHFCAVCHDDFQRLMRLPKNLLPHCPAGPTGMQLEGACPLRITHPPTGEEFALGCGICRNLSTF